MIIIDISSQIGGSSYNHSVKGTWKQLLWADWQEGSTSPKNHSRTIMMMVLVFPLWSHVSDYPHLRSTGLIYSFCKLKKLRVGWQFWMWMEESLHVGGNWKCMDWKIAILCVCIGFAAWEVALLLSSHLTSPSGVLLPPCRYEGREMLRLGFSLQAKGRAWVCLVLGTVLPLQ